LYCKLQLSNLDSFLEYLEQFADRFDRLEIIDASKGLGELGLLLKIKQQQVVYLNPDLPIGVEQTIINIADKYRNNSRDEDNDEERGWDFNRGR
jgi:hypothetical protein